MPLAEMASEIFVHFSDVSLCNAISLQKKLNNYVHFAVVEYCEGKCWKTCRNFKKQPGKLNVFFFHFSCENNSRNPDITDEMC